jgi:hypothetical protein
MPNNQDELTHIADIGEVAISLRNAAVLCVKLINSSFEPDTKQGLEVLSAALVNNAAILETYFRIDPDNT